MTEGLRRVRAVQAGRARAEHHAFAVAHRNHQRAIETHTADRPDQARHRVFAQHALSFMDTAGQQHLEEARKFVGGRIDISGRDHRVHESLCVRGAHHFRERHEQRALDDARQRKEHRRAGKRIHRSVALLRTRKTVTEVLHAQRLAQLPIERVLDRFAGHTLQDLGEDEAAGDRVVGHAAAARGGGCADHLDDAVPVLQQLHAPLRLRDLHRRKAAAMCEHVGDRCVALAGARELRNIVADACIEIDAALLGELVDQHGGHRFRGREQADRRLWRQQNLFGIRAVARAIAAGVTDRAVEHDDAVAAQAEPKARIGTGAVQRLQREPDLLGVVVAQPGSGCDGFGLAVDRRDGFQIAGNPHFRAREHGHGVAVFPSVCLRHGSIAPRR